MSPRARLRVFGYVLGATAALKLCSLPLGKEIKFLSDANKIKKVSEMIMKRVCSVSCRRIMVGLRCMCKLLCLRNADALKCDQTTRFEAHCMAH